MKRLRLVRVAAREAYVLGQGKIDAPDGYHVNDWPEDRFFTIDEAVDWFETQLRGRCLESIAVKIGDRGELPSKWTQRVEAQKKAKACEVCGGTQSHHGRPCPRCSHA